MKPSLLLLVAFSVWGVSILPSHACELAAPDSIEYSLREDNRCEGVRSEISVNGSLDLISLTSSTGGTLGRNLQIRVPRYDSNRPAFLMREPSSRYQWDSLPFSEQGDFYTYSLTTRILNRAGITDIESLRARAVTGTQRVYLPTILGQATDSYRFVFYSVDTVKFTTAGIRRGNNVYVSWGTQTARSGEKAFEWTGVRNMPAGRYEFYYEAEIDQGRRAPERLSRSIVFEHDPDLLR